MMYDTVRNVLKPLPDSVIVYPAHGAGTLCGKALFDSLRSMPNLTEISQETLVVDARKAAHYNAGHLPG